MPKFNIQNWMISIGILQIRNLLVEKLKILANFWWKEIIGIIEFQFKKKVQNTEFQEVKTNIKSCSIKWLEIQCVKSYNY